MSDETRFTEAEAHLYFAKSLNGEVWGLLKKADRTADDDERMVHAAHASHYHWLHAGTAVNRQRGEWMIARVYSELGLGQAALRHARRCHDLTQEHAEELEDFDRAYALEALARAFAVMGSLMEAQSYRAKAREAGEAMGDEGYRKYFMGDLEGGNWQGAG